MAVAETHGSIVLGEALRFAAFSARTWPGAEVAAALDRTRWLSAGAPDPERRVPITQLFALWAEVTRAVDDPSAPIRFAQSTRVEDAGVLGFAALTAPSGKAAVERAIRYQRLISNSGAWRLEDERGSASVRLVWERPGARSLGHRLANETALAEMLNGARQVLGAFALAGVGFRHAPPRATGVHDQFFGVRIDWQAKDDYLELPRELLERTPLGANAALGRSFVQEAERRLASAEPDSVAQRVRAAIEASLVEGGVEATGVARQLGLSERSLRRALAEAGSSFREVLDDARKARALELLARKQASITDTAFLLGFSETSAFSRAFRRWFGVPPRAAASLKGAGG